MKILDIGKRPVDGSYYSPSKFTLRIARTHLSRIPDFVYANSGANTVVKELMSLISSGRHKRQNVPVTPKVMQQAHNLI